MVLAALFVGAFVIALDPIADGDIFWHLAAGREMVHRHALLDTDTFTRGHHVPLGTVLGQTQSAPAPLDT